MTRGFYLNACGLRVGVEDGGVLVEIETRDGDGEWVGLSTAPNEARELAYALLYSAQAAGNNYISDGLDAVEMYDKLKELGARNEAGQ